MAVVHPQVSLNFRPDGLAVTGTEVFRSGVELNRSNDTQTKLQQAKERLYVLCQLGGWGLLWVVHFGVSRAIGNRGNAESHDRSNDNVTLTALLLSGIVITHFLRPFITRWGWKDLGWRLLVPRVLLFATLLSLFWCGLIFGYYFCLLNQPWDLNFSRGLAFSLNWLNEFFLLVGWLCLYFFYHIFERLNRLQVEQLRLIANVREAELRALKSQVNPHFLFNSLNSLRALIDEDAPRARESVTRLANMLRYSLQSGQLETVPLEEEIRIVEDYLALEQIRHENRLRVRWDITDEVRRQSVPPMLLQTLVENAVKYGISVRREGGELTISARVETNCIHIRVTNPGDLNAPTSNAAARAGSSTGVGLRNASERLKLLFGERATLQLLSGGPDLVTADVCIPLKPANP